MENEVIDTQSTTETTTPVETAQPISTETQGNTGEPSTQAPSSETKMYTVKVDGKEMQFSEPELIKYAQLGKKGQRSMEYAASLEKKQKAFYGQLVSTAEKDVFALYEALTGKRHPMAHASAQAQSATDQGQQDPRDIKLREYEEKLSRIEQKFEADEVEKERQAVATELADAVKKYPELNTPYHSSFVKDQYRRALKAGLDHSLEDIAFLVAQDVREHEANKRKELNNKLDENKKKAPVMTTPGSGKAKPPSGIEYARKLAGLT